MKMIVLIRCATLAALGSLAGQTAASTLFEQDTVLKATLEGPLTTLIKNKRQRKNTDFKLHVDGTTHDIKVRVRGKSRIQYCGFPPLRLEFSGDQDNESLFFRQQKLKLVTHCNSDNRADVNVLEEFAAYQMFGHLTPISHRTRLMEMRYRDTESNADSQPVHFAVLLESHREVARRVQGRPVNRPTVSLATLDREQAATVFLYNYMIGNTDYSLIASRGEEYCCHNGNLVDIRDQINLVPYDFDLSGLVNARYARPKKELRIKDVTQRRYVGYCLPKPAMQAALRKIKKKEAEMLAVWESLPALTDTQAALKTSYLGEFFQEARSEERLLRSLERHCL